MNVDQGLTSIVPGHTFTLSHITCPLQSHVPDFTLGGGHVKNAGVCLLRYGTVFVARRFLRVMFRHVLNLCSHRSVFRRAKAGYKYGDDVFFLL